MNVSDGKEKKVYYGFHDNNKYTRIRDKHLNFKDTSKIMEAKPFILPICFCDPL